MKRDHSLYIKDILDAIQRIEDFAGDITFEEFVQDDKTSSAVLRKLEIIGEAAKKIPPDIRKSHSQIPWKEMAGIRSSIFILGLIMKLSGKSLKNACLRSYWK